jgi:hypothetical protein
MHKKCFLLALTGAALLCGCGKQTKINSEKIQILSQNILQLEQSQAKQMSALQTQLTSLAPMLDKINDFYFEKSHDDAFFYHTNTLFLLLTVDKKIEAQLQVAETEHTAQIRDALAAQENQTRDAMAGQEKRIEENVNAQTAQADAALREELLKQIKLATPDAIEIARLKEMEDDVAQIKRDVAAIRTQLGQMTNPPPARL